MLTYKDNKIRKRSLLGVRFFPGFLIFGLVGISHAGSNLIRTEAPGNTFFAGQEVILKIDSSLLEQPLHVVDYWGRLYIEKEKISQPDISLGFPATGWYAITVGKAVTAITVVPDLQDRINADSSICADVALSWLIPEDRFTEAAELLGRAGIRTIRDRFSWREVESKPGEFSWGKYAKSAEILKDQGIRTYTVFHDTPAWSRSNKQENFFPDDLRTVYRFMKETGKQFTGAVDTWEIWNEADISNFSPTTGSDYAAFLKAASLGLKDGNPKSLVLINSLASPAGKWLDQVMRDGGGQYFDIYNYHIYADPGRDYGARAQWHLSRMARWGISEKPVWLTEAGIPLPHQEGVMAADAQQRQVRFIPKAYVMSLASGVDKHFFFVIPWYLEEKNSWGVWHSKTDLTPYPGYAALSTAAWMLGWGHYVGRLPLEDEAVHVYLLKRSPIVEEYVLVLWNEGPAKEIKLPESLVASAERVVDAVGLQTQISARQRSGYFQCCESPIYIPVHLDRLPEGLKYPAARPKNERPAITSNLPRVVLRLSIPTGKIDKQQECITLSALENVTMNIEIYNFYDREVAGNISVYDVADSPRFIQNSKITVSANERMVQEIKLPVSLAGNYHILQAAFEEGGKYSAPASIEVRMAGRE